jgi:hypothetical protein
MDDQFKLRHDPVATARGSDTNAVLYLCRPFHGLRLILIDAYSRQGEKPRAVRIGGVGLR